MAMPGLDSGTLLAAAARLGCVGVEFRNDLPGMLFEGRRADDVAEDARAAGLRVLALSEVKAFNDFTRARHAEAAALCATARALGAEAISLIPRNDGWGLGNGERQAHLRLALREIKPLLEAHGLMGFVEPLGFDLCALRHKAEALDAIAGVGGEAVFRLVHDTFHHHLAGETEVFAQMTGIVHVSGVTADVPPAEMTDAHRGLVDAHDRLGTLAQIERLRADGYAGPISFEPFAPEFHRHPAAEAALATSIAFLRDRLKEAAA